MLDLTTIKIIPSKIALDFLWFRWTHKNFVEFANELCGIRKLTWNNPAQVKQFHQKILDIYTISQ